MKTRLLLVSTTVALLAAGCGRKDAGTSGNAGASDTTATAPAASAAGSGSSATSNEIDVTANDQMKFTIGGKQSDPTGSLTVEAKAKVPLRIVLTNSGTAPIEVMGHNFVLLKPGSDPLAFSAAAVPAKATDYIPDSLKNEVIAHTKLLGPQKSDEITVTLAPGEYPFLCSFPAHAQVGMRGKLVAR